MKTLKGRIFISILLTLLLAAGSAMANPLVNLGSGSAATCGQVVIPITLTNDGFVSVAGVGVDIGYDSTNLTPLDATIGPAGQLAGKSVAKNIVSPGLYRVLVFSTSDSSIIGNGIVANVTFEISCEAPAQTYTLSNTPSSSTPEGLDVPTDGSSGSIQVGQGSTSTTTAGVRPPEDHIVSCMVCHADTIHTPPTHTQNCAACHTEGNNSLPQPKDCIVCHPIGNTGTCNLVNFHDPAKSTPCLSCHVDCNATTSDDHINQCLICHPTDFSSANSLRIHSRSGHSTCSQCHTASPPAQSNFKENCETCHPLSGPGRCDLVDVHFPNIITSCGTCHMNCPGGGPATTTTTAPSGTTTTISGGTTTTAPATTSVPATTTILPNEHFSICRTCHLSNDLHAEAQHNVCSSCHTGTPGLGNVTASECIVCHPNGNPGQCNLVKYHGNTCTNCHTVAMCPDPTTTTTVPAANHMDMCLDCHYVGDIHAKPAHTGCTICHTGTPQQGNVSPGSCVVCHPFTPGPGKCNLVIFPSHSNKCISCHADCAGGTPSTTTTTTPSASTTTTQPAGGCQIIRVEPVNGIKLGLGILPRIAKITVTTNSDLNSLDIIDCDFQFANQPKGIYVLGAKIIGSSIQGTVLFVGAKPGTYTILLGECGSAPITLSRFWWEQ